MVVKSSQYSDFERRVIKKISKKSVLLPLGWFAAIFPPRKPGFFKKLPKIGNGFHPTKYYLVKKIIFSLSSNWSNTETPIHLIFRTLSFWSYQNMRKTVFSASATAFLLCYFCFANSRCSQSEQHQAVATAFYHWQTKLHLTPTERSYLDSLGVKKLYVKFFDVDWDEASGQPVPLATIEIDTSLLAGLEIVPTVFITNRTLLNLPMPAIDSLASRILQKIGTLAMQPPTEIQFDCDWTDQTQAKYFALLTNFQLAVGRTPSTVARPPIISATIRLHQLKYLEKTGVPPVDRGMLMCYNMDDLENWDTENSIIDPKIASSYMSTESLSSKQTYPLPLDVALPLFRWGVLFRDGQMIKLLNNLSEADLKDSIRFKVTAPNRYEVVKSTYMQAHYLYAGDQLRLEAAGLEAIEAVAALLNNKVELEQSSTIAFYHLDTSTVRLFPKDKIKAVLRQF